MEQKDLTTSSHTPPTSATEPSDTSSFCSRRSFSIRPNDTERNSKLSPVDQHHLHYQQNQYLHPQSDVSWDDDSSSTSGYRESFSMQLVSIEDNKSFNAPPLASPDLNDIPSSSSTATNYMGYDGSSPDCSFNGSGGEKTTLLDSSQRTASQHSIMVFQAQDEDTLI